MCCRSEFLKRKKNIFSKFLSQKIKIKWKKLVQHSKGLENFKIWLICGTTIIQI